ncbi:MAG TPA: histidinol-phosphatase HisJ family protein [Clostridiaceae bacterium]|nr:histidinol-phosphatase HisJ family protein [Clostridiaceae bacterium]
MFDNHMHSFLSFDSDMDLYKACETALKKGLNGIAFTDHLDYDFPGYEDVSVIDFDKYMKYMDLLKNQYEPGLKIIKGIEVGIQPHVINKTLETVNKYEFDLIIASIHVVDGKDPYEKGFYDNLPKNKIYSRYLELILFMINNYSNYDIVGHFDFIIRKANYYDRSLKYADYSDLFDAILKKIVSDGKGFEINTRSYLNRNDGKPVPVYDKNILLRYKELGGEIITLGSDSHSEEHIGYKFEDFSKLLLDSGFKYVAHYENRKPVFTRL